jgi:cell division septum initiation protein DivIVA
MIDLQTYLEEKFTKQEEEDAEFQESLEDRLKGLEDENKDLKERIHELSMGQKVLPTKGELNEEISSQRMSAVLVFESVS